MPVGLAQAHKAWAERVTTPAALERHRQASAASAAPARQSGALERGEPPRRERVAVAHLGPEATVLVVRSPAPAGGRGLVASRAAAAENEGADRAA